MASTDLNPNAAASAERRLPDAAPRPLAVDRSARRRRVALFALIVTFIVCAATYSVAAPLWEASDESEHFQYIVYLATEHQLPTTLPSIQPSGNNEGNQPPLYYLLVTPLTAGLDMRDAARIRLNPHMGWLNDPTGVMATAHLLDEQWPYHGAFLAAHRIRLLSAFLGGLTVLLTYAIAREATGDKRPGLLAAALLALLPGFLFSSATIDNDVLANVVGALLLLLVVWRGEALGWRSVAFGVVAALALVTKLDLLPLVGLGGLALLWRAWQRRNLLAVALLGAPVVPALLFWLWRINSGTHNLIGDRATWPPTLPGSTGPLDWTFPRDFAVHMWVSLLGAFGRQNVLMPGWLYFLYGVVYVGGLLLGVWFVFRRTARTPADGQLRFLALWIALPFLAILGRYFLLTGVTTGYDSSRFLYPALPALITLSAVGLQRLAAARPRLTALGWPALAGGVVSAFALPWLIIAPTYPAPFPVTNALPAGETAVPNGQFSDTVKLAAIHLPTGAVTAGQAFALTLYWQVQQPLPDGTWLFIHVVNAAGQTATAFDGAPLYNTLPLSYWRHGDVVIDREILTVHKDAAPGVYTIHIGWYNPKGGARVPLATGGTELQAGTVTVAAPGQG